MPDITTMDYLRGAGREYPPISDLIMTLLASQYGSQGIDPRDFKESIREKARSARGYIGGSARDSIGAGDPSPAVQPAASARDWNFDPLLDDTLDMQIAYDRMTDAPEMVASHQPSPDPVPQQRGPTPWEQFQQMNPNLDYDAVVRQAGGVPGSFPVENEWGGAISEMPDNGFPDDHPQSDAALFKYVREDIPMQEAMRKLDSASRAYDPQGAAALINMIAQKDDAAAQMIYSKAQETRAEAEAAQAEIMGRQAEFARSPEGQMRSTIEFILQNADPLTGRDLYDRALRAQVALMNGNQELAMSILKEMQDSSGAAQKANETDTPVIG